MLGDLAIEVDALLRLRLPRVEQEKAVPFTTRATALRHHTVELGLLPAGCLLVAADLLGARRIGSPATIDGRELTFETRAKLALVGLAGWRRGCAGAGRPRLRRSLRGS